MPVEGYFSLADHDGVRVLRLQSADETNRLTRLRVLALIDAVRALATERPRALIIAGNERFFSAGAELSEVRELDATSGYAFSRMGQELMNLIDGFPAPAVAAIEGYCLGGGLDLALSCDVRIAHPHAIFGHRGAALGLITGWGGTQRLPRLVGRARALQMFLAAEKLTARHAAEMGLVQMISDDPVASAINIACRL